jgi:hypothetical protein
VWVEDSLGAASYLNRFDIQYASGSWLVGARLETDEESWWDEERGTEILRRFAEYSSEQLLLRGGSFYATIGRGLVFRAMEDEEVRIDRDVDGVYGSVNWRGLEAQALAGRPRNDETHLRDDFVSAVDLMIAAGPALRLGGAYARLDAAEGDEDFEEIQGRPPLEEIVGGRLQFTHGPIDAMVEGAQRMIRGGNDPRGGWESSSAEDGHAWYGSVSVGTLGYVLLLEGKHYLDFDAPYVTPPPVNYEGRPINDGFDERGLGLTFTVSPSPELTFEGNGSWAEASDGSADRGAARAIARREWWGRGALQIGGEWTREKGLEGHDEREYYGPMLEASYYLDPTTSLQLVGHVYARRDSLLGELDEYTEVQTDLTLSQAATRSLTLSMIWASNPVSEFGNEDLWLSLQLSWTFGYNHDLLIKVGEERGGIVCSGGVCHYEPPFAGVRVELVSRL